MKRQIIGFYQLFKATYKLKSVKLKLDSMANHNMKHLISQLYLDEADFVLEHGNNSEL